MYLECPQEYKFHFVDELGSVYRQDRPYFSFSESVHWALAKFFLTDNLEERTLSNLQKYLEDNWLSKGFASKEEESDWKSQAYSLLESFFRTADIKAKPIYIEEYFRIPFGETMLSGRIDRIDKTGDGYEIIDYKIAKIMPKTEDVENDLQLSIYQLACAKQYGFIPNKLSLYMLNFDKKITVIKKPEHVLLTEQKIKDLAGKIKSDKNFQPKPTDHCNRCDYNIICPAMGLGLEIVKFPSSVVLDDRIRKFIHHLEIIRNDLYALNKANTELSGILEKSVLKNKIMDVFVETAEVDWGILFLKNDENKFYPDSAKGIEITEDMKPPASYDFSFEKATIIDEPAFRNKFPVLAGISTSFRSAIFLPIAGWNKTYGFILLVNKLNKVEFNNYDCIFLSNLANMAAISFNNAELYELAIKDGLTNLFVHSYFQTRLENEMFRAQRYNSNISLLMIDIDHFKKINDMYGHQEGDGILKKFASILLSNTRKVDIAARYGGEEFAVILPETDATGARQVAENFKKLVENGKFIIKGKNITITASIGVATWDKKSDKMEFIRKADTCLYKAKANGRNRICVSSGG